MSIRHTSEEGVSDNNAVKLAKIQRESTISIPTSKIQDLSDPAVITSATNVGSNRPYNNGAAVVSFTPSATGGTTSGAQFTNFVATSTPGSITGTATTSPVTVTGLSSATSYTFKVAGVNVSGTGISSASSGSVAITTVPQAPTAGTPSNVPSNRAYNNGRIDVPITANANGGSAIISYLVTSSPGSLTGTGLTSPISVTGLSSNTAYTFTAQAVNANGTSLASTASTSATATTVPEAPTLGTPTDVGTNRPYNNGAVSIPVTGGNTGGSAITSYTSTSTPGSLITSNAGTTPLIATGLTVGTTYGFTVTATNANGVSTGTTTGTNVVPTSVPQTPTLGTVTTTGGSVYVPFTAGGTGGKAITSYTIVSSPALTLTYSGTTSPITVTAAYAQGQAYTFTLTAVNANGSSITTSASNAVTPLTTITDNFNRTGSSLGISSSGTTWVSLQGSWTTNGTQAVGAASGTSLSSVPFGNANATVSASVSGGTGVAFWVTDANSWWAAYPNYIQNSSSSSSCTGGTVYCYSAGCTPANSCGTISETVSQSCTGPTVSCYSSGCIPNGNCGSITEETTLSCPTDPYTVGPNQTYWGDWVCYSTFNFTAYIPATVSYVRSGPSAVITGYTRSSPSTVTTTTYTYDTQIKVVSSVSGSVVTNSTTTLVSAAASLSPVNAVKVITSGNTATTQAYSNTAMTTTLGSAVTTTNTGTKGTSSGIIKTTSTYSQGTTVDDFSTS